ncbi:MAG: methyltransferase domain-containing protein [Rhodospirillaceae bacterium]|jgi:SAM-dependent methyltransferase|nr:methyltransferase domain-containing protein [Rhodospirillaceae bacterium]MBT5666231.1 methyltransferase domain-containing protein [Rhodospirillaceae bacterium]MBT5809629.1 methyltransferase domain-containing protein [Rhodospirillaceae bacterium]
MSDAKRLDTVRLQNIAMGFWESAALMAGIELGLFTAISKGAGTDDEVAAALDITTLNAERLVTVCMAMNLVSKAAGRYQNADDVDRFLVEDKPGYAGPWMLFTKPRWDKFGKLSDYLRNKDEAVLGQYEGLTVEAARRMHQATSSIGMGAARRFVRHVDLSERTKILDLGGGSGAYSINAAKTHPHIKAVVFDLPPVAVVAREYIAEHDVGGQVEAVGGDFTKDDLPTDCDVAIMASNLPLYSRPIIAQVIQRAFDALLPGGEMHLIGETLEDDRSGPIGPALWGMAEAMNGSTGLAHTEADCIGYFEQAGFTDIGVHEFVAGTLSRITGTKPA